MLQYVTALASSHLVAAKASVTDWIEGEEEGQGLVEYALIIVLVSIVAMAALKLLGSSVSQVFTDIKAKLDER
jgi:pilus assembly protein Flp/PilA